MRRVATGLLCLAWMAAAQNAAEVEFFEKKIRPVLATRCYACHSAQAVKPQGGLLLDSRDGLRRGGNSGAAIIPGDPQRSLLVRALRHEDAHIKMPPGQKLPDAVIADFEQWVGMGAPDPRGEEGRAGRAAAVHWAFVPPKRTPGLRTIDEFVRARLRDKGLELSSPADPRTLLRRLSYDLTGLPPSYEDLERFAANPTRQAYESAVDRLLSSPAFGERWARHWLDVARYADTKNDAETFPHSYTYRDWVIAAFNRDLPYDQFILQQIAADLQPGNDRRNLAALGFLTLGRDVTFNIDDLIDDRIDVVTRGFLGLTVSCARCHDHKYDPIPTRDYYALHTVFAGTRTPEDWPLLDPQWRPGPRDRLYEASFDRVRNTLRAFQQRRLQILIGEFREPQTLARYLVAAQESLTMSNPEIEELVRTRSLNLYMLRRWRALLQRAAERRDGFFAEWREAAARRPETLKALAEVYGQRIAAEGTQKLFGAEDPTAVPFEDFWEVKTEGDSNVSRDYRLRLERLRVMHAWGGGPERAMALEDVPSPPQKGHIYVRGNPNNPGAEVERHFLSILGGRRFSRGSGRLELAEAIANRDNPLTARVMVNRVWAQLFGRGLVATPSDFGVRGEPPSHPELLDHLALDFMEQGWSVKRLIRQIVLSEAYRQSSADRADGARLDPENRLLWRQNRRRLDFEALRDSMLAVSGGFEPGGGAPFSLTARPAVRRRTVYAFIDRARVPNMLSSFDFPEPDAHAPQRHLTTIPQQALFFMNSPFVVEQAQRLAAQVSQGTPEERIRGLYRRIFGRDPEVEEISLGLRFTAQDGASEDSGEAQRGPWSYGMARMEGGRVVEFRPFRYFDRDSWRMESLAGVGRFGLAQLNARGGVASEALEWAVTRRWTAPLDGEITISGKVTHREDRLRFVGEESVYLSDGIRARIVSSREGELASYSLGNGMSAEARLERLRVRAGDVIDFAVEAKADADADVFLWAPVIELTNKQAVAKGGAEIPGGERREGVSVRWDAAAEFRGPEPVRLNRWEQYAQALLSANEFAFID